MLIYFATFVAFLACLHISMQFSRTRRILSKIPGPFEIPLIGSLYVFTDRSQRGLWVTTQNLFKAYPLFKLQFFHKSVVCISHPDDLKAVLSSPRVSYKELPYIYLRPWLGNGIFSNKGGDSHKDRRKLLAPVFNTNMLRGYINVMNDQADDFINGLRVKGKEYVLDILPLFTDVTLNIVVEATMGVTFTKNDISVSLKYKKALEDQGQMLFWRFLRPYLTDYMFENWTTIGRKQNEVLSILHELTNKIIRERRKHLKETGKLKNFKKFTDDLEMQQSGDMYYTNKKQKLSMLDMLLAVQQDGLIDDKSIREEVDTFLLGGTDTTRMVLAFFTMLIAENKDVQDKVRAEVCEVLDESGGRTGTEELQRLPYLEQCIKESMRLYPAAPAVARYTIDDVQLMKDYVIPSGVTVVCNTFNAQRNPNFWKEPEKFDPERFSPENIKNQHPYAFLPFSAGPRNCIGQKFGMMEVKAICAKLLYNFIVEPVDRSSDMKLISDLVLRPEDPFHTKFVRIDRN